MAKPMRSGDPEPDHDDEATRQLLIQAALEPENTVKLSPEE